MCGVSGVVSWHASPNKNVLDTMLSKLTHRGPQGAGTYLSNQVAMGMQRLAIRGLSDHTQPLVDEKTGVVIVCNGEIDNYEALTTWLAARSYPLAPGSSDVAVLLPLYLILGEDFLKEIKGAFALAVWDPRTPKLLLARDRAGERPLFYTQVNETIYFSSEMASLHAALPNKPRLATQHIANYLQRGCFVSPETGFELIYKVKPASLVCFTPNGQQSHFYWQWAMSNAKKVSPTLTAFDAIFSKAITAQSNIDVDFGLFLSGGVDSSLIAALARKLHPEKTLPCYTLRFSEASYDEGSFAARVADKLKLPLNEVLVKPDDFPSMLEHLIACTGEPLADPALIPTALLAARASKEVRLVLSGEGGDELFGGYPTYFGAQYASKMDRLPKPIRTLIHSLIHKLPTSDRKVTLAFLLKRFIQGAGLSPLVRHQHWTAFILPELLNTLKLQPSFIENTIKTSVLNTLQQFDFEHTLAEGLLTKADRAGMHRGLEIRCPFLDKDVIEFAATLPEKQRVKGIQTKVFLKAYACTYLPKDIVYRKKRGLSVPLASWLRGPLAAYTQSKLESGRLADFGIQPQGIQRLLNEHFTQQTDHARALWTLLTLDEWINWTQRTSQPHLQTSELAPS